MVLLQIAEAAVVGGGEHELGTFCLDGLYGLIDLLHIFFQPRLRIQVDRLGLHLEFDIQVVLPVEPGAEFVEAHHLVALLRAELLDLGSGLLLEDPRPVGRALEGMVMGQVKFAVLRHADVRLEAGPAGIPALLEGDGRVFVALEAAAPVGEGPDRLGLGKGAGRKGQREKGDNQSFHVSRHGYSSGFPW